MNIVAAIVLPLQGFFNCLIYLFFSRAELCKEYRKFWGHFKAAFSQGKEDDLGHAGTTNNTSFRVNHDGISQQEMMDLDASMDLDNLDEEMDLHEMLNQSRVWARPPVSQ
jgi:hypothetical protein